MARYCLAAATSLTLNRPLTTALSLPFDLPPTSRLCDFLKFAPSSSSSTVASSARFLGPWQSYLIPGNAQPLPLFFFPHTQVPLHHFVNCWCTEVLDQFLELFDWPCAFLLSAFG